MAIINGQIADADEVMNAYGFLFSNWAQTLYQADYTGWDSRLYWNAGAPNLNNVKYDTFQNEDNVDSSGFEYNSSGDYYKPWDFTSTTMYWLVIEASDWTDNGYLNSGSVAVTSVHKIDDGKWMVVSDTSDYETNRAILIGKLHVGGSYLGPNVLSFNDTGLAEFTTITAIRSPDSRDVGKTGQWAGVVWYNSVGAGEQRLDGTFADTSTNTNCSSWSYCQTTNSNMYSRWWIPTATQRNSASNTTISSRRGKK